MDDLFGEPQYMLEIDDIDSDFSSVDFSEAPFSSSPHPDQEERGDSGDDDGLHNFDLFGAMDADADNSSPHSTQSSRQRASSQDSDNELFVRQVNVLQDHFSEILDRETRAGEERQTRAAAAGRAAANRRAEQDLASAHQRAERAVERAAELGARGPIVILRSLPRGQQDFRRPAQPNQAPQQRILPRLDPAEFAARLARRHHPYRMPAPHPAQQNREQQQHEPQIARGLSSSDEDDDDLEDLLGFEGPSVLDELIEMEFNRLGDEREPLPPRRVSRQPAAGAGASAGAGADAGAGAGAGAPARHRAGSSLRAEVSVIDLTEEPDSPEDVRVLPNANRARARYPQHRNPRRQMSFGNRTPSLTRSDGSLLGAAPAQVIDLTIDDDAPPGPPPAPFWGGAPANRAQAPRLTFPRARTAMEEAEHEMGALFGMMRRFTGGMNPLGPGIGFLHRLGGALGQQPQEVDVQYLGGNNHAHNHDNPLGNNLPNFNYRANGYNNPGSPKPVHVSPPPAREGFSRGTGEELAFVCPSCEDELTYDPDEEEKHPAKKARTKKDREEHHFWAVKECGHVYCRACYENRRTKTKTTFRAVENPPRKLLCAVEDCNSDVNTKAAWVGLFL